MDVQKLKQEFRLLHVFYIFFFLSGFSLFILPYWIIYFNEIGLTFTQISIILSFSLIAPLIFEVPTGAIADMYGRKISVALSLILVGFVFSLIAFTKSFITIAILFFLAQAAGTLSSGADKAWLVDYLKSKRKENLIHTGIARTMSFALAGSFFGLLLSGFLVAKYGLNLLWILTGLSVMFTGVFALIFGKEHFKPRKINPSRVFAQSIKDSIKGAKFAINHHVLLYLIIASFFLTFVSIGQLVWQPFLKNVGIPVPYLGPLFAILSVVAMIFTNLSMRFLKTARTEKRALIISEFVVGILLLSIAFVSSPVTAILVFVLLGVVGSLSSPISSAYFQKFLPSSQRATIGSFQNWVNSIGGIIVLLIGGVLADAIGPQMTLVVASIFVIPAIISYLMIREKDINRI